MSTDGNGIKYYISMFRHKKNRLLHYLNLRLFLEVTSGNIVDFWVLQCLPHVALAFLADSSLEGLVAQGLNSVCKVCVACL
jgi:hypothetical protein